MENEIKSLIAQGTYIINNYDDLKKEDVMFFETSLTQLVKSLRQRFVNDDFVIEKTNFLLKTDHIVSSNSQMKKIQIFFNDWYGGIIGNNMTSRSLRKSPETFRINHIVSNLNGLLYYLRNKEN